MLLRSRLPLQLLKGDCYEAHRSCRRWRSAWSSRQRHLPNPQTPAAYSRIRRTTFMSRTRSDINLIQIRIGITLERPDTRRRLGSRSPTSRGGRSLLSTGEFYQESVGRRFRRAAAPPSSPAATNALRPQVAESAEVQCRQLPVSSLRPEPRRALTASRPASGTPRGS
jgi:hypothetical protein